MLNLRTELERGKKGWRAFRLYRQCVQPGALCFDIGANKGSRAIIFTLLGARTIAVEPNATLTKKLQRFPRVVVVNKAVTSQPGTKTLLLNKNDQISSLNPEWKDKWPEFPDWHERTVECVTLDQLIASHGMPDFCKIDVEGHEREVLAGLSKPIRSLSFEAAPDFRSNTEGCVRHLGALGKYEFNLTIGDDFVWIYPKWVSGDEICARLNAEAGDIYARLRKH